MEKINLDFQDGIARECHDVTGKGFAPPRYRGSDSLDFREIFPFILIFCYPYARSRLPLSPILKYPITNFFCFQLIILKGNVHCKQDREAPHRSN